jgi:DNA-binding MarR family transcriptional regulator
VRPSLPGMDPIVAAHRLWVENGWADCADGLAAVTSIMRVRQLLTKQADQVLAPIELTFARYEVLVRLNYCEGGLPLAVLGKLLQLHQTSITSLVDKLEAQGLIVRTPHPTDRRSTIAEITPTGRSLLLVAIERLNRDLFRDLGLSGDEVRGLIGVLTKMRRAWGDFEDEPDGDLFAVAPGPAVAD